MTYDFQMLLQLLALVATDPKQNYPDPALFALLALKESSGNPLAFHTNSNGSIDRGLWQINSIHETEFQFKDFKAACYTPSSNAQLAIWIWQKQGYRAWSTYNQLL